MSRVSARVMTKSRGRTPLQRHREPPDSLRLEKLSKCFHWLRNRAALMTGTTTQRRSPELVGAWEEVDKFATLAIVRSSRHRGIKQQQQQQQLNPSLPRPMRALVVRPAKSQQLPPRRVRSPSIWSAFQRDNSGGRGASARRSCSSLARRGSFTVFSIRCSVCQRRVSFASVSIVLSPASPVSPPFS
jgi:hypothetical protein